MKMIYFALACVAFGYSGCTKSEVKPGAGPSPLTIEEVKVADEGCKIDSVEPSCSPTPSGSSTPLEISPAGSSSQKSGSQH